MQSNREILGKISCHRLALHVCEEHLTVLFITACQLAALGVEKYKTCQMFLTFH